MVGWEGWSAVGWLLLFFAVLIAQVVVGKKVAAQMKDEVAGKIASYGVLSAGGAAICAIASFDMQLIQVVEGYYVEDVFHKGIIGGEGSFYTIQLTLHGFLTALMLTFGAMMIVAGAVGIVIALYKKGGNREGKSEGKKSVEWAERPAGVEQKASAKKDENVAGATNTWKRVQTGTDGVDVVICPNCGTSQRADRSSCYNCGAKYQGS